MTLIYAHRGASGYAPENTLAAFDRALEMRSDGIETDVQATRDGVLVLLHDRTVDRTTDGAGAVADMTFAELQRLDAGSRFDAKFTGERVPRLDDFLARYAGRTRFWLEIKAPGIEAAIAAMVQARGLAADVQFSSFNFGALRELHRIWPQADSAFLTRTIQESTIADCRSVGVGSISLSAANINDETLAQVHAAGLELRAWGLEDRETVQRLIALGVAGMTLNWPDWAEQR